MGSPKTNAWKWGFYTPHLQICEIFPYTDEGWAQARRVEDSCILPDLNNPLCLNEHVGGSMSLGVCRKAGKLGGKKGGATAGNRRKKEKTGICSPEYIASDEKKATCRDNGKKNGARNAELGLGFCSPAYRQSPNYPKDKGRAGEKGGLKTFQEGKGCHSSESKEKSKQTLIRDRSKAVKVEWVNGVTEIFYSANEASRVLGAAQGNISRYCRKETTPKRGRWAGVKFTYVDNFVVEGKTKQDQG